MNASTVSDKVQRFIDSLPRDGTLAGIVFAQRRATVAVLAHVLFIHPQKRSQFRVETVVGASQNILRSSNICDLVDREEQGQTLLKFRSRQLDLVIATTFIEEGVDIPACNLVLCSDGPANLMTFVQRRGRARTKQSQLVLKQSSKPDKLSQWQELELEMKRIYADDMRQLQTVIDLERLEEQDRREFTVESTGEVQISILNNKTPGTLATFEGCKAIYLYRIRTSALLGAIWLLCSSFRGPVMPRRYTRFDRCNVMTNVSEAILCL
jgi:ERCC4-related helicase